MGIQNEINQIGGQQYDMEGMEEQDGEDYDEQPI
jgi:hypothetical protein